jgi:hypothetical protein
VLEHARQPLGPEAEQDEHELSHVWHVFKVGSKNWAFAHVGRQRPLLSTGRSAGQVEHWLKLVPEHVAQSGWHVRQVPEEENALEGHELTHLPCEASWPPAQVRQKVEEPRQDPHDESHFWHVMLSVGDRKVPAGQLSVHVPLDRTKLGRQAVHVNWLTVEATLKFGMPHAVHLEGQPE